MADGALAFSSPLCSALLCSAALCPALPISLQLTRHQPSSDALLLVPSRRWMDWSLWHFWFADERYVPVGDVQSNHRAWKELMFDDPTFREFFPVETNVHRVDTALSLKRAAAAYASEFERVCGGEALPEEEGEDLGRQEGKGEHEMGDNSNREVALGGARSPSSGQDEWLPATMHATLLGMGGDGHTASLFPRSVGADGLPVAGMEEAGPSAFCAIEGSPKPPPRRISLTYSAIAGSHSVIFVAGGGGKAAAVRRALQQQESATVPAGVVSRSAGSWAVKAGLVPKAAAAAAEADDEDGPLQQVVRRVVPVSTEMDRLPASAATTTTTAALMAAAKTASGALWILDEDAAAQLDEGWLERVRVWPPRQVVTERKEKKENSAGSALHDEL